MKALRRGITNALRSPRFYTKQFGFGKVFKAFLGLRCELGWGVVAHLRLTQNFALTPTQAHTSCKFAGLELQARLKGWRVVVGYGV